MEVSAKRIRLQGGGWHVFGQILENMKALGFDYCKFETERVWSPDFWTLAATTFEVNRDIMVYFYASEHDPYKATRLKKLNEAQSNKFSEWLTFNEQMKGKHCECRTCKPNGTDNGGLAALACSSSWQDYAYEARFKDRIYD